MVLLLTIVLFVLVTRFLHPFLFFILGYDVALVDAVSPQSFEAYKQVHGSKLVVLAALLLLSLASFSGTIRLAGQLHKWTYPILFILFGCIAVVAAALMVAYFMIPTHLLQ